MVIKLIGIILLGYFLGAIPFGIIIGKFAHGIDVRKYGSGNIGFANVLRTAGTRAGVATLLCDVAKGALPAWLATIIIGGSTAATGALSLDSHGAQVIAALAAVIGHNWPIYLRFRGGKGVDTSLGGLIAMSPWIGLTCLAIGLVIIFTSRYVSVGSMLGTLSSVLILAPLVILGHQPLEYLIYGSIATILVIYRHRGNIANLRAGTERRLGQKGEKR